MRYTTMTPFYLTLLLILPIGLCKLHGVIGTRCAMRRRAVQAFYTRRKFLTNGPVA